MGRVTLWRRMVLPMIAAAGVVAAAALAFSSTGPAPTAMRLSAASGSVAISNSRDGQAVLIAQGLRPGEMRSGSVTIGNTGVVQAQFTLVPMNVSGALAAALGLRVFEQRTGSGEQTVYDGTLAGFSTQALGQFQPGESRTYRFEATLPANVSNGLQGASANVDLRWTAESDDPGPQPTTTTPPVTTPPVATTPTTPVTPRTVPRLVAQLATTVVLPKGGTVPLSCKASVVQLRSCSVQLLTASGKRVQLGSARATLKKPASTARLRIALTRKAQSLVAATLSGVPTVVQLSGATTASGTLKATARTRLYALRQRIAPPRQAMFGPRSSTLTKVGIAFLARIARQASKVTTIQCRGYAGLNEASGQAGVRRLALARARSACSALRRNRMRARFVSRYGSKRVARSGSAAQRSVELLILRKR